jgi:hypothetical protein
MNWTLFAASCTIVGGLLLKLGAPIFPFAVGLVVAAALTWRKTWSGGDKR